jgi:hypothetical protein
MFKDILNYSIAQLAAWPDIAKTELVVIWSEISRIKLSFRNDRPEL